MLYHFYLLFLYLISFLNLLSSSNIKFLSLEISNLKSENQTSDRRFPTSVLRFLTSNFQSTPSDIQFPTSVFTFIFYVFFTFYTYVFLFFQQLFTFCFIFPLSYYHTCIFFASEIRCIIIIFFNIKYLAKEKANK